MVRPATFVLPFSVAYPVWGDGIIFKAVSLCTATNTSLEPRQLDSIIACAAACAGNARCNAFHYNQSSRSCYVGDACAAAPQWTAGDCRSFKYAEASSRSDLLGQLQMKLFYRFKTGGLVNLVNPRLSCLTAHDVMIGRDGAEFRGHNESYLSTEVPGYEQYLDYGKAYSFFTQVRHNVTTGYQYYHQVQQCSPIVARANIFLAYNGCLGDYAYWKDIGIQLRYSKTAEILPRNGSQQPVSVGFAFNATVHQHFYYNGSLFPVEQVIDGGLYPTTIERYQCLRLGHNCHNEISLNGTMQCFGFSTQILGKEDFVKLDQLCTQG